MVTLSPFLLFDGNCAEAMRFYRQCLGGDLTLTRLGDTPMAASFPAAMHDRITYAQLDGGMVQLSATDWLHPTRAPQRGNMTAILVTASDRDHLRRAFAALSDGAAPAFFVPLGDMPFGLYGRFTDRFGVEWFFRGD